LRESNSIDLFPIRFVDQLHNRFTAQQKKNGCLIKEMERLHELFTGSGIEVIFLKGPFFTLRFYGDLGKRAISDIDLLIRNKEFIVQTDQMLRSDGFELRSIPLFSQHLTTHFTHHFEYRKNNTKLDLHWVLQSHFSFKLDYDKIWQEKQTFLFDGKGYEILSDEYELVFRILSIFMDTQLGTIRGKSLVDLYIILRHLEFRLDWDGFFASRRKEGLFLITINVIDLVLSLLNCRDDFGRLAQIVEGNQNCLACSDVNQKLRLLKSSAFAFRNKIWAFRLYDAPFWKSFFWWLISLPFKISVYREVFLKSFKRLVKNKLD
jgi:hypothetical protein